VPAGSAKAVGVAIAGIVGYNFAIGGDYDTLAASYGLFPPLPANYTEHLSVSVQQLSLASVQACGAFEGGAGVGYQVKLADSAGNSFSSTLQEKTCAHLVAGAGGEVVQGAVNYLQFLVNSGNLTSDATNLANAALNETKVSLSTASELLKVLDDLQVGPVGGSVDSVSVPLWQSKVPSGCPYGLSVSPIAALTSLGAGVGAGEITIAQSSITISGIAVPDNGTQTACYSLMGQ
jgi:hypothetical protein